MNRLIIFGIWLLLLGFKNNTYSQDKHSIDVQYLFNGKTKKIRDNSQVLFIQNGDTTKSIISHNTVYIPTKIKSKDYVDVLFHFDKKELFFASISTKKLFLDQKSTWELGSYEKFGEKEKEEFYQIKDISKLKEFYYWKFKPKEFGDGTITLVTVDKD